MTSGVWKSLFGIVLLLTWREAAADWISVTNLNAIAINDGGGLVIPAKASPYPSTNVVAAPAGVVVSKVTLTLRALTHSFPSDISMLLVGPQGQRSLLMSEVGGQSQLIVNNLTLTIDDDALSPLPVYTTLTSGAFKPTNGYLTLHYPRIPYDFPAPVAPGSSNAPSSLSVFKGTNPNGPWRLFIVDDAGSNSGMVSGGWILNISTAVPLLARTQGTNLVLSWTNVVSGCTLQGSSSLTGGWTNVLPLPSIVNGQYTVTNRLASGAAFYRLVK
jgi:subtilisin-like proprotein convertase family protein